LHFHRPDNLFLVAIFLIPVVKEAMWAARWMVLHFLSNGCFIFKPPKLQRCVFVHQKERIP
jgi:hypothetical protein